MTGTIWYKDKTIWYKEYQEKYQVMRHDMSVINTRDMREVRSTIKRRLKNDAGESTNS